MNDRATSAFSVPATLATVATVWCLSLCSVGCDDEAPADSTCEAGFELVEGECVEQTRDRTGQDASDDSGLEDANVDGDAGADGDAGTDGDGEGVESGCAELTTRCTDDGTPQVCAEGIWTDQVACSENEACQSGRCAPLEACAPGAAAGCSSDTARRVCNEEGNLYVAEECGGDLSCFRGVCGSQICEPERLRCGVDNDLDREVCAEDGESWITTDPCDDGAEQVCFEGECVTGCLASIKDPTYIGCEYWSVDLPQYQDPSFTDPRSIPHSVVLANTTERQAEVTIETQAGVTVTPSSLSIPAGGVQTVTFPRLDVEGSTLTNRSFRIRTTEPIVAYQFNPLNDSGVFSNDASLLLPASAIGVEYYVMSWPGGVPIPNIGPQTGWFTVVAVSEETTIVEITFSSDVVAGTVAPLQGITAGSTHSFPLTQWSVLNFEAQSTFSFPPVVSDLTGTHISSNVPIVVFAGHEEAVIGEAEESDGEPGGGSVCCADHLEEQMFPVRSWGTRYLAVHSPPRGTEDDFWRVLASEPGTVITTIPQIDGLNGLTLNAGEWVEIASNLSFEIDATSPIFVTQYLVSQTAAGVETTQGDPAMILTVPVEQYRDSYVLLTPDGYARDFVTVVRPAGVEVTIDLIAVPNGSFLSFGTGEFEYAHVEWEPGPHRLASAAQFGVVMIGYDSAVSYGYPGGLNLNPRRDF